MPGLAFFLWCFLVFLLLGVRALVHFRRTGTFGYRVPSPADGWRAKVGPVLLAIGGILVGLGPFLLWLGWAVPLWDSGVWLHGVGFALAVGGIALTWWCQHQMGDSWRFGSDSKEILPLVVEGVFAHVRHPIYSADLLAFLGIALLAPHPCTWLGWGITILAFQWQVRVVEEPLLERLHGDAWLQWASQTPRFLPWGTTD